MPRTGLAGTKCHNTQGLPFTSVIPARVRCRNGHSREGACRKIGISTLLESTLVCGRKAAMRGYLQPDMTALRHKTWRQSFIDCRDIKRYRGNYDIASLKEPALSSVSDQRPFAGWLADVLPLGISCLDAIASAQTCSAAVNAGPTQKRIVADRGLEPLSVMLYTAGSIARGISAGPAVCSALGAVPQKIRA